MGNVGTPSNKRGRPLHGPACRPEACGGNQARPRLAVGGLECPRDEGVDGGLVVVDPEGEDPAPRAGSGVGRMEALADVEADEELVAGALGPASRQGQVPWTWRCPSERVRKRTRPRRPPSNTHITSRGGSGSFARHVPIGRLRWTCHRRRQHPPGAFGRGRAKGSCTAGRSGRPKGLPNTHLFVKR